MSVSRWALCALLLALIGAPLSVQGLQVTSYGGWPAVGFAIALYLIAGRERIWLVTGAEAVVVSLALMVSYDVPIWIAFLGSVAVILPALFAQHLLTKVSTGHLRLDEVDSGHYHLVTALAAAVCALFAMLAAASLYDVEAVLLAGLMSFLAALTAQLAVLPLLIRSSGRQPAAGTVELVLQRVLLVGCVLAVFWPTTRLGVGFVIFPMLGWAAIRATRRETHIQLFLVCVAAYALTLGGRGPLAGELRGVPEPLAPALLYLFMAAACYMAVPLTMAVERLFAMTGQATRAATTVERLLDSVSGAMIIASDAAGRITHFNAGAQQTLGYEPEDVMGQSPEIFSTQEELQRQADHFGVKAEYVSIVLEMARRGERREWQFMRKDGSPRMASLTLSSVTELDGKVIGYIGAGDDITEQIRAQEALITALDREHASVLRLEEVDHVKQELVSNVSHELRTPITSIAGYAELLADGSMGGLNEEQIDAVHRITRNTGRLGLLVEDLLTLSKAESGQLELEDEEIDLRDVATEVYEMLEEVLRVRSLDVVLVVPDEPTLVTGDAHALEQVVTNLMGNAIKFTPDGGRVTLTVSQTPRDVKLTVEDTGMGIPEEDQEHLFTRFFRASGATENAIQGTGLGLSIVHSIVLQHGGDVTVASTPGSGTTVTVLLPRLGDQRVPREPIASVVLPPAAARAAADLSSRAHRPPVRSGADGSPGRDPHPGGAAATS
jgi:PAS domain S-box-containing protein